ncbi:FAD-binding oxidoreductase [Nocardioides sp. CFH 31398]|uniref:FAD-binding oxidoreductase n=1 Tax=Nocardioides sp. CFH 31398 TaxID=2919579 RepID=UPI001F055CCB|nr:FAD-binding oxidoreductase [Nocardioides sp. CFH 31398]MCH1866796.1 FAD-binding oxidoreductase [Nocardioides sp. CFH 31398]
MTTQAGHAASVDTGAREALGSACAEVRDATEADAVDGVAPALVARPGSVDEVAEVVRAAAAHRLRVVPRGAGTKLTWGHAPSGVDVLLDLGGLDRVTDHAAGDLIVAAQAGTPLARLQETTATEGQRLTLDETVPGSTIGGILATNASGARRTAVGSARDLLIGITMVRHDGIVAKAGGRVVKNVAGYDLGKLLIGSMGTLGVVVDATFRLHPLPAASRWVTARADSPARAMELAQAAVHGQVVPAAVEVGWEAGAGTVSVLLEGRESGVQGRVDDLSPLLGGDVEVGEEPPAQGATYPWDTAATGDDRATALKVTFALSGLADVLATLEGSPAVLRGSAGSGVVYAALPSSTPVAEASALVDRLRATTTRHGGATVVVDAPAAVKDAVDVWGPVPALALMRRVKDQFDPDHRLSPGRYVGGM